MKIPLPECIISKSINLPIFIVLLFVSFPAAAQTTLPVGFQDTAFELGFDPSALAIAPDGRLFVADKDGGAVRVIENGVLLPTPFVTVAVAPPNPTTEGFEGLNGIAFDPNFPASPYVYVHYTLPSNELNRVSRFTVSAANPDIADPNTEFVLLDGLPSVHADHIHFGIDGMLYVSLGGVHSAGREQRLDSYEGKLLRINPDGSVPTDNPVFGDPAALPGIWAYGFRNPFSFAVDPVTGALFINDVGDITWEEINVVVAAGDYGWPSCEGSCSGGFVNPLYQYPHSDGACAITGGTFYRGSTFPSQYAGSYFFLDFCADWIRYLDTNNVVQNFATGTPGFTIDMAVGQDGSLYYLSRGNQTVQRIEFCGSNCPTDPIVYEAEDFILTNGNVASTNCICGNPSAGQCARNEGVVGIPATSSTSHTGLGGLYQVDITYCDESDDGGAPDSYGFYINGVEQVSWFSSNGSGAGEIWQTESATVNLATGDFLSIDSTRGGSLSWSRLDYMMLTPIGTGAPPVLTSVLITPAGQPQMTVDPQQGFSVIGSAFTAEAFDQYGDLIEANFSCTVTDN